MRDAVVPYGRALALLPKDKLANRAAMTVKLGWAIVQSPLPGAVSYFEEGLVLSRRAGTLGMEAGALRGLARIAYDQGRYDEAERHLERALALCRESDDREGMAYSLHLMVFCVCEPRGDADKAERLARDSLALFREIGHQVGAAQALRRLAAAAGLRGEYEGHKQYLEESLEISREIGARWSVASCLNNLGEGARQQGKYEEAVQYYQEALAINKELGIPIVTQLANLGLAHAGLGEDDVAWGYLREALKESLAIGRVPLMLESLVGVAWLRAKAGHYAQAAKLLGLVLGRPAFDEGIRLSAKPVLTMLREAPPADELEAALERGKALDLEQVVAEILEEAE